LNRSFYFYASFDPLRHLFLPKRLLLLTEFLTPLGTE
jgi:hypothetical protein